jgi:hypothetical protein
LGLTIVPITYCMVLCSVLVHGLSIPVFTNSRRLHKRVSSFSRTFTAQSSRGAEEPSWLSRVRRVGIPGQGDEENGVDGKRSMQPSPASGSDEKLSEKSKGGPSLEPEKESLEKPGEEVRWQEGDNVIVEDPSGEHAHTEHHAKGDGDRDGKQERSFADKAKEVEAMILATERRNKSGKGRASDEEQDENEEGEDEDQEDSASVSSKTSRGKSAAKPTASVRGASASPSRMHAAPAPAQEATGGDAHRKGYWWKRDEKTGLPRPLTPVEKKQAKRDRAVRKERHYCTQNSEVRWREGNRVRPTPRADP